MRSWLRVESSWGNCEYIRHTSPQRISQRVWRRGFYQCHVFCTCRCCLRILCLSLCSSFSGSLTTGSGWRDVSGVHLYRSCRDAFNLSERDREWRCVDAAASRIFGGEDLSVKTCCALVNALSVAVYDLNFP